MTVKLFSDRLREQTNTSRWEDMNDSNDTQDTVVSMLRLLADATEYKELPVRHNEVGLHYSCSPITIH